METINITRRSKVGFGYTSAVENDEQGNLRVCKTDYPCHVGTILQVQKMISKDNNFQSLRSGAYYSWTWFVKNGKQWLKITNTDHNYYEMNRLSCS